MEGMITDIERFALNDGPGIRTTVFFKGCNMHCAWCHNPETIGRSKDLHYHSSKCIGCYKCVYACPSKAHKRINNAHMFYPRLCVKCGKCAEICYAGAMEMCGRSASVDDIMAEIVQDKAYYSTSGGGVTLSGGEVLCQLAFAEALTDACHAEGISVGIETNLSLPWEEIRSLVEKLDLVMCDLKLADSEQHRKWTGLGNEQILENLGHLAESGKPFIVRTPVVSGATDSEENIAGIAQILAKLNTRGTLMYYELLNFNPLGGAKYSSLGKANTFANAMPLSEARMQELRTLAQQAGIAVRAE